MNKVPFIQIESVSFTYPDTENAVLRDFSLEVQKGECVLLCGESGCGKTTVTRLLNGLIPHYYEGSLSGTVYVNGKNVADTPLDQMAGFTGSVFQNPRSQFFCVDTTSELAFGCENMGLEEAKIRSRIEKTVRELSLERLMDRSIFKLSGGEKQKIACGGVHAMDVELIIMDEPTSNLDLDAIDELKKILRCWKEQGKTIVIAEHRLSWLSELCDRVIFLKDGRIASEFNGGDFFGMDARETGRLGLRGGTQGYRYLDTPPGVYELRDGECIPFSQGGSTATDKMELTDFLYSYGRQNVLDIRRLELPADAIVAVIGHNGAGKSTFVKCLCGLQKGFRGKVQYKGKSYNARGMRKLSYMVMQDVNHQLFAESVMEEAMLGMTDENEQAAMEILTRLDLAEYKDRHPMSLSGGQKQRTAIASALLAGKEILIFDEPTSGLDYKRMIKTAELLKSIRKGKSIFIITHDMELIQECCTHILHIENGSQRTSSFG